MTDAESDVEAIYVVLVTVPNDRVGEEIARTVVSERLAACVNLLSGLRSIYQWEGAVRESAETLLMLKTTATLWGQLEARVRSVHPYNVPEIVALPLVQTSAPYAEWIRSELRRPQ